MRDRGSYPSWCGSMVWFESSLGGVEGWFGCAVWRVVCLCGVYRCVY
jgi:hypothetical protein